MWWIRERETPERRSQRLARMREKAQRVPKAEKYDQWHRWQYGISLVERASLMTAAGNACEVCERTHAKMCIDHDHSTGRIRGVLCSDCNVALGAVRDDPKLLWSLMEYLADHSRGPRGAVATAGLSHARVRPRPGQ